MKHRVTTHMVANGCLCRCGHCNRVRGAVKSRLTEILWVDEANDFSLMCAAQDDPHMIAIAPRRYDPQKWRTPTENAFIDVRGQWVQRC